MKRISRQLNGIAFILVGILMALPVGNGVPKFWNMGGCVALFGLLLVLLSFIKAD